MAQLTSTAGDDVPTLDEVRSKIDRRLAAAQATTELTGASVDIRMIEVENAQQQLEAQARLREMRTEMGISAPPQLGSGPELSVAAEAAAAEIESEPTSG
jgi:phage shock protein A